jgi:hypothetical protein
MTLTVDDIVATYLSTGSIRATSRKHAVCTQTVRRILITNGVFLGDDLKATHIVSLLGIMPPEEVANKLGCSIKTIKSYMPYSKGSYAITPQSANAERIARCRQRKRESSAE